MAIQRIEQFLNRLRSIEDNPIAVKILCENELDYLRKAYDVQNEAINGVYSGLRTYIRAIASYRRAIYDFSPNHISRQFFRASEVDALHNNNQNQSAKMRGLTDTDSIISNIDGFIETSIQLCERASYADNILGIAALTGRRVSEVAYFSNFSLCDEDEFSEIYLQYGIEECDGMLVENLAKKETYEMKDLRLRNNEESINKAIIPVLYSADFILKSIKNLRDKKSFESHEQFHNQSSKELSKRVKKHYEQFLGKCACHDLRKAYCRIVFDYFCSMPEKAVLEVYAVILAQTSPANYTKFSCA